MRLHGLHSTGIRHTNHIWDWQLCQCNQKVKCHVIIPDLESQFWLWLLSESLWVVKPTSCWFPHWLPFLEAGCEGYKLLLCVSNLWLDSWSGGNLRIQILAKDLRIIEVVSVWGFYWLFLLYLQVFIIYWLVFPISKLVFKCLFSMLSFHLDCFQKLWFDFLQ